MEQFEMLSWRVNEPSVLDIETSFIKEKNIIKSYVYQNNFTPDYFSVKEEQNKKSNNNAKTEYSFTSCLNKVQHLQGLKALQLLESEKPLAEYSKQEQQLINIYNNLKLEIVNENKLFLKNVQMKWTKDLHHKSKPRGKTVTLAVFKSNWKLNEERIKNYNQYYNEENMISLSGTDTAIEVNHELCLLELGNVSRITIPNMVENPKFCLNKLPYINRLLQDNIKNRNDELTITKLAVSQDIYAEELAKHHGCDIVISSSGLKTIIDNYGPDYNSVWDIPIIAKEYDLNGITKKIIFVDKPFPQKNVDWRYIRTKCFKLLLKNYLCQTLGHSFQTPDAIKEHYKLYKNQLYGEHSEELFEGIFNNVNNSNDTILLNSFGRVTRSATKNCNNTNLNNSDSSDKSNEANLLLTDEKIRENSYKNTKHTTCTTKFHQNVSYRIWKLKLKEEKNTMLKGHSENKEIKLLVRCKLDGSDLDKDGILKPISIIAKLEYQIDHGGEIISRSELLRQWTTLFFRPFSNLLRFRMNSSTGAYIKKEDITLNKIVSESWKHYSCSPAINLGILYSVLSNISKVTPGNYILHHIPKHGSFATLMKSVATSTNDSMNLHELYKEENFIINEHMKWYPIDTKLILPYHVKNGHMPGIFPPQLTNGKRTAKNKAKKKKKKNKNKKTKNCII